MVKGSGNGLAAAYFGWGVLGADRGVSRQWLPARRADRPGVSSGARGGVDAEVAGEPGQAVRVALSCGAQAPGSIAAVDLEADERGFYGRGGLEHVLGGRAGGGGDDEVVDVGEAAAARSPP